ncbi:MAG TPA: hypothetical protein VF026_03680 [Ktedonobacteraceae bacterium]
MESTNTPWTGRDQRAAEDEIILDQPEIDEEDLLDQPAPVEQRREQPAPVEQRREPPPGVEQRRDQPAPVEQRREPPPRVEQRRDQPAIIESTIQPPLPKNQRPKGRRNRRNLLLIVLGVIVVIAVAFSMLNRSSGSGAVNTTGQSTPLSTSTPISKLTPKVTVTTGVPANVTAGALILLNPGIVRPGASTGVFGSGFHPRATVDLVVKQQLSDQGQVVTFVQTDKNGVFTGELTMPATLTSGSFFIEAHERGSKNVARARGMISGGTPQLKLGPQVGKPGDMITVSLHGFSPGETINVYWNAIGGQPAATLQADGGGGVGQAKVQVPFGAPGANTFLFVGAKSHSLVTSTFFLLSLYPSVKLSNYAIRADNQMSFSGSGFGPGERVLVFLNSMSGQPAAIIQTTQNGSFSHAGSFVVPFDLKGRQTLIFLGEQSGTSVAVNWTVQPYMPNAQTSTYGGLPGTTVSFYATGFARNEVVHVYVGGTQNSAGTMVSCFSTDQKGNAGAAGSYIIPGNAQGKLVFKLTGSKSGGTAIATMSVSAAPSAVQVPTPQPFTCPLDTASSTSTSSTPTSSTPTSSTPTSSTPTSSTPTASTPTP